MDTSAASVGEPWRTGSNCHFPWCFFFSRFFFSIPSRSSHFSRYFQRFAIHTFFFSIVFVPTLLIDVFQMFAILFSQILFSRFFTCFPPSKGELLLLSGFAGALSAEMTPLLSENGTWDRAVSPQNQGLNPVNLGFHQEDLSSTNRNWVFKPLKLAFRTLKRVK